MAGTLDRVVTYVATQLMLAAACTAAEVSENAWLRGAYRVGQGDAMTSGRSVPCRSFTKVHAVSELKELRRLSRDRCSSDSASSHLSQKMTQKRKNWRSSVPVIRG
jgi:hypothetical protein